MALKYSCKQQLIKVPSAILMTASDRFMKKVSDYYNDLGYPVTWDGEGSKRSLEIQFKAESGYFTSAIFSPSGDDIIVKDEWGREQTIKAQKKP